MTLGVISTWRCLFNTNHERDAGVMISASTTC